VEHYRATYNLPCTSHLLPTGWSDLAMLFRKEQSQNYLKIQVLYFLFASEVSSLVNLAQPLGTPLIRLIASLLRTVAVSSITGLGWHSACSQERIEQAETDPAASASSGNAGQAKPVDK
jgi:hypothetical protein